MLFVNLIFSNLSTHIFHRPTTISFVPIMIVNGSLSYASKPTLFESWHPQNEFLHNVLLALITTIISFQACAIIIDLFFGCKPRGKTTTDDIQTLCLVRGSTPVSLMRNLFPKTFHNTKRHLRRIDNVPINNFACEIPTSIPAKVVIRLFFLMISIPLIHVILLVIVFERERNITFSDASFGGVGFAPSRDFRERNTSRISPNCQEQNILLHRSDSSVVTFSMCYTLGAKSEPLSPTMALVRIEVRGAFIKFTLSTPNNSSYISKVASMSLKRFETKTDSEGDDGLYFLHHAFTKKSTRWFLESALSVVREHFCHEMSTMLPVVPVPTPDPSYEIAEQLAIPCISIGNDDRGQLYFTTYWTNSVSLVETKKFLVTKDNPLLQSRNAAENFVNAGSMVMLKRRGTLAPFLSLVVACVVIVVVRLIVFITTRNDVETGFGLVVREVLGLPCLDSMLVHPDVIVNNAGTVLLLQETDILGK